MFVLIIIKVMKRFLITSILAAIVATGTILTAQERPDEYLGLPGDNLNLYAVMKLFQESETLEGFERSLNDENSKINNLDLNGDNLVDYLKVIDYVDGDVHTIALQAVLNRNETQDVAVFTVQRFNDGSVQIQLTGDDTLYGKNYIIEPIMDETPNPGYTGRANDSHRVEVVRTTTVQIAAWPVIRYIYLPGYIGWRSSWYWGYYPGYWHTWRPFYWHYYYGYHYHWYPDYYRHYRHWNTHRYTRWNDFYYNGHRSYSRNVAVRINEGHYKATYSHPEQRKDGERLYTQAHPERGTRESVTTTGRRSDTGAPVNGRQQATGTGNSRRSNSSVSSGTSTRNSGQNNSTTPRSAATGNSRVNSSSSAGQSTVTNRRSTETTTNRSVSKPEAGQSPGTSRRSSEGISSRPASRPESARRTESSRSTKQATSKAGSSARRTNEASRTKPAAKSSKSKESDKSTSSRRK
jgi:hypothetical protein